MYYLDAKRIADQEKLRADQAEKRAEQAEKRAERGRATFGTSEKEQLLTQGVLLRGVLSTPSQGT